MACAMGTTTDQNILVAGRRVCGVIDWNESHVGLVVREVAFAGWEFGHDEEMRLVHDRFRLFVNAYRSEATHLPEWEYTLVTAQPASGFVTTSGMRCGEGFRSTTTTSAVKSEHYGS